LDMPRRVSTYAGHLQPLNDFISASAFVLGGSMLIFVYNLIQSLVFVREPARENPWHSRALEWQVPTPVPAYNFAEIPVVTTNPYEYGVEGAPPVATLRPGAGDAAAGGSRDGCRNPRGAARGRSPHSPPRVDPVRRR